MPCHRIFAALLSLPVAVSACFAADWARFRGENGSGVSKDSAAVPTTWSDTENLKWSVELPGPGLSSPIVVGDRVFVTSWTGYAAGPDSSENQDQLKRALVCIDRGSGEIVWTRSVDAVLPEDDYQGMFAENGYASHTPVSDGERVYCFFGKSGVVAFDMAGNQLWQTSVGTGRDPRRWGSASSPILYGDLLIVTAAAESESLVGLNKSTGEEVWKQEASSLAGTWSTPVLAKVDDERTDLVLGAPFEMWGMNPETGKLRWFCEAGESNSVTASVVVSEGPDATVYRLGGRDSGSLAVRVGGKGDVSDSHVRWRGDHRAGIGSPVLHNGRLYWIARGIANCIDTQTGEEIYKKRLPASGIGGGVRGSDYASPIAADGKLYYVTRGGIGYVMKLGDDFEIIATNRFASDDGEYSATPAVSDGELFIRSTRKLYCVAEAGDN